jgi:hypothetical protein
LAAVVVLASGIWPAVIGLPPNSVVDPVVFGAAFVGVVGGAGVKEEGDGSAGFAVLGPSLLDSLPDLSAKPNRDLPSFDGAAAGVEELNGADCGLSAVFGLARAANGFGLSGCSSI